HCRHVLPFLYFIMFGFLCLHYYTNTNTDNLTYTYFESQFHWILKFDENSVIRKLNKYGYDLKQINSKLPDNIKVYAGSENKYFVLLSKDRIVSIRKGFNEVDDAKFLSIVYNKLFKD
ncbi:hypothetical protein ACJDUG_17275, partial [Clostridium sp. WILCCON 0185]